MGKKIRSRSRLQRTAAARSRAAARVLGRSESQRRSARKKVSGAFAIGVRGRLFINKELIDDGYVVIT